MPTLPSQLQNSINANAAAGASYAGSNASGALDDSTQAQIAQDYATGAGVTQSAYGAGNSIQQTTNGGLAIVAGWSVLADPTASIGSDAAATAAIIATAEGVIWIANEYGLLAAAGVSMSVPVLGWIVGAALLVAAILTAVFSKALAQLAASGNPIVTSSLDQVNAAIYSMWQSVPIAGLNNLPFTPQSRAIAAQLAAYVQTMRAKNGLSSWCSSSAPAANQFGYQCQSTDAIHLRLSAPDMLGSGVQSDAILSIASVLWDPRWQGNKGAQSDPSMFVLGTAGELDPYGGANPEAVISASNGGYLTPGPVTNVPGMSAASFLCEVLAVGALNNVPRLAQTVYLAAYVRVLHATWLFQAGNVTTTAASSVAPLFATLGFLLTEITALGALPLISTAVAQSEIQNIQGTGEQAILAQDIATGRVTNLASLAAQKKTLAYWVNGYIKGTIS